MSHLSWDQRNARARRVTDPVFVEDRRAKARAISKAPLGRVCRWCGRTDAATVFPANRIARECGACISRATRNGRDSTGRPVELRPMRCHRRRTG